MPGEQDDNFEAAFNLLANEDNPGAAASAVTDPPAADPPAADPPAADPPAAADLDPPAADPPAADPPAADLDPPAAPAAPTAQPASDDVLRRLADLVNKGPATPAVPAPAPAAPVAEAPALYTAEEESFLTSYQKDWPDVAKAEALVRRAEYRDLVGFVFREIAAQLNPLTQTVQVLSERTHFSDLTNTVTDYNDVRDKVVEWVDTQPVYLQVAYKHVIQQGTVEEVADLIGRYKQATGTALSPPAPVAKDPELPSATKQAAASLAPVSSKRSVVPQQDDPNDFESAFAQFASKP